jgi:hypothetical protein
MTSSFSKLGFGAWSLVVYQQTFCVYQFSKCGMSVTFNKSNMEESSVLL